MFNERTSQTYRRTMADSVDLTGQVAIVTGGDDGIGTGVAEALARYRADVVIAEIDPDRAAQAAAAVERLGRRTAMVPTDVMDTAHVRAAVARADEELGRLDTLVNNAD